MKITVRIANSDDKKYASIICKEIESSAKVRGTGISKRDPEYIKKKMDDGFSVIAFFNGDLAGFSYFEVFENKNFLSNSGLIVFPKYRLHGLAKMIKLEIFKLSKKKFTNSKIFSITTSPAVIKINTDLGFNPVLFSDLTKSKKFWKGCKSCTNYDILIRNKKKMCLCTGLLYDPKKKINLNNSLNKGDKILLAYSGGLDTSYCLKYLTNEGYKVITIIINTGVFNNKDLESIEKRAINIGAISHYSINAKEYFYSKCIKYLVYGNILKNNTYPLSVSSERFFQAILIAEFAKNLNVKAISHGSTGAGNDQVRFDLAFQILCPNQIIVTPIRDMKLSRKEEVFFLKSKGVKISWKKAKYSINKGIWGTSIGGEETLKSSTSLPEKAYPTKLSEYSKKIIELKFKKGELFSVNKIKDLQINNIIKLEKISSKFAIGRDLHVGDTILGIKGRVGFEASAALLIIKAHKLLEKHILTKWQISCKEQLSTWYGNLLHEAQYLDPIMRDIECFFKNTQKRVSGKVTILLNPYRFELIGIDSNFDMMKSKIAKYGEINNEWTSDEVKGFIKIFGNQMKIYHNIKKYD
ncbi:argininosuccinate synthase domain-containing protein [Candidatus Karelsulcia muelleri]|uniref:argininosuccinate synthase domain-containing protein n=1 Tax=Candidatus Karelsulcia muelleri TaxID=336810 RepID=UPI00216ACE24|nr:argininosuccinate synthase domain-containing protein [Candidatus Karelsulcia muelleri]